MNRNKRLSYYREAARFWFNASELQRARCLDTKSDSQTGRADMNFYVVAVQRIREIARMAATRCNLPAVNEALKDFDTAWPRFKELRNLEEHTTGPGTEPFPFGIWYFQDVVAELGPKGKVKFLLRLDDTHESVRKLLSALEDSVNQNLGAVRPAKL